MTGALHLLVILASASPGFAAWDRLGAGLEEARVGQWVTYALKTGDGWTDYLRLAVVDEEKDALGRPAWWLELDVGQDLSLTAPLVQLRALVAKAPGPFRRRVTRVFAAQGADGTLEVEPATLAAWLGETPPPPDEARPTGPGPRVVLGREGRVSTALGSLPALTVEVFEGQRRLERLWISPAVELLHLAKWEVPAIRHLVEVVDQGLDARPTMILPEANSPKIRMDPGVGEGP